MLHAYAIREDSEESDLYRARERDQLKTADEFLQAYPETVKKLVAESGGELEPREAAIVIRNANEFRKNDSHYILMDYADDAKHFVQKAMGSNYGKA